MTGMVSQVSAPSLEMPIDGWEGYGRGFPRCPTLGKHNLEKNSSPPRVSTVSCSS